MMPPILAKTSPGNPGTCFPSMGIKSMMKPIITIGMSAIRMDLVFWLTGEVFQNSEGVAMAGILAGS